MGHPVPVQTQSPLRRVVSAYKAVALIVFNTILVLLLFNIALTILFWFRGGEPGTASANYHPAKVYPEPALAAVYPGFSKEERNAMLTENWSRTYVYEDYVLFKERPYSGKYVNVSEAGIRFVKDQGPWPPAVQGVAAPLRTPA